MRPRRAAIRVAVLAVVSLSACGGSGSGPTGSGTQNPPPGGQQPGPSTSNTISVENNRFAPATTTVDAGTTVTWTWNACSGDGYGGQVCGSHSVTFSDGTGSPTRSAGSYSRQFTTAGTFTYVCSEHGGSMSGQVVVR